MSLKKGWRVSVIITPIIRWGTLAPAGAFPFPERVGIGPNGEGRRKPPEEPGGAVWSRAACTPEDSIQPWPPGNRFASHSVKKKKPKKVVSQVQARSYFSADVCVPKTPPWPATLFLCIYTYTSSYFCVHS